MPDRVSMNLDIDPRSQPKPATLAPDAPFRILVLGNFSGRGTPIADATPIDIDPDNFEKVMESLRVELHLTAASAPLTLQFRELDDFDPDHLYQTLPLFRAFRDTRKQLENPQTFRTAAARFQPAPTSGSLLDAITGESEPGPALSNNAFDDNWDNVIRRILAGHTVPSKNPRQDELVAQVDTSSAAELRAILHHPDFQSIESAWRSLFLMFRRIETSVDLKISIADVSQSELMKNPPALRRILIDEPGETPWSAIAALYTFSPTEQDCDALSRIAKLAAAARAPFIAAMHPSLLGCESIAATPDPDDWDQPLPPEAAAAWQRLRRSPEAVWLGLAMPRFLLRLPYGQDSAPIESFDFEESPAHENYLWGNPAVACACLLGEAFNRSGWASTWNMPTRIDGMPIHVHDSEAKPQAEIWMTDRLASRMMAEGIMPLASIKNTDSIQLLRFQSISDPPRALAAPW
jgi:type VI secretion system protein ImpC